MAYNAYASAGPPKPPGADQPVVIGSSVGLYGPAQGHWLREAGFMGESLPLIGAAAAMVSGVPCPSAARRGVRACSASAGADATSWQLRRRCGADKSDSSWTEIEHAKKRILENVVKVSVPKP